jgi:hypothetical protein
VKGEPRSARGRAVVEGECLAMLTSLLAAGGSPSSGAVMTRDRPVELAGRSPPLVE